MNTNDSETVREVCDSLYRIGNSYLENYANRILAAHEREIAKHERCYHALEVHCKKLEDDYLKATAALKPVMECVIMPYLQPESLNCHNALNAVNEAQRVMREGGEK